MSTVSEVHVVMKGASAVAAAVIYSYVVALFVPIPSLLFYTHYTAL